MADLTIDLRPFDVAVQFVRGDDFYYSMRLGSLATADTDIEDADYPDLTDWTISGQVRAAPYPATPVLAVMDVTLTDQVTDPGGFSVLIAAADTADFPDTCIGDIEFTNEFDLKRTFVRFTFSVDPEYTVVP
jgi:hypothetical protein